MAWVGLSIHTQYLVNQIVGKVRVDDFILKVHVYVYVSVW